MKNFVKLIKQVHAERFSVVANRIVTRKIPVAFLSVAPIAQAVEITKNIRAQGLNVMQLITVDNPPRQPADFDIVNLKDAAQIYPQPEYVWVAESMGANLARTVMGGCKIIFPASIRGKNTEQVYEIFMTHLPELQEVYESLLDEESKRTFRGYWFGCIANRIDSVIYANTPHYFLSGFAPKAGDIFIDGGCYNGWTAAQFAKLGCKVYSFEMNKTNFDLAGKLAAENDFVLENLGLGSHKRESHYIDSKGASRLVKNGTLTTTITTLDDYVRENNLPRVDYIKLDVEGSELDVLKGAAISISCWKPRLAISAYHKLDDLWTLMNFIKSIRPDYEFALRQYATDYASAPHAFDKNDIALFETFDADIRIACYEECVLFAR